VAAPSAVAETYPEVYWGDRWLMVLWIVCAAMLAGTIFLNTWISLMR
jgi:hypothetical protein